MKINKVKLYNFSSYEGNNEFDFEITDAGKNILTQAIRPPAPFCPPHLRAAAHRDRLDHLLLYRCRRGTGLLCRAIRDRHNSVREFRRLVPDPAQPPITRDCGDRCHAAAREALEKARGEKAHVVRYRRDRTRHHIVCGGRVVPCGLHVQPLFILHFLRRNIDETQTANHTHFAVPLCPLRLLNPLYRHAG